MSAEGRLRQPGDAIASSVRLNAQEAGWVNLKWKRIRRSQRLADEAANRWSRVNAEINDKLEREGETDVVQLAKIKGESLALKDALATHAWHRDEANRHIQDLNMFLELKKLGLL